MDMTEAYTDPQPDVELAWTGDAIRSGLVVSVRYRTLAARACAERFNARMRAGKPLREKDLVRVARVFVRHVNGWTLRGRGGRPVPATLDELLLLDVEQTVMPMLRHWLELVRKGPVPAEPEPETAVPVEVPAWFTELESRNIPPDQLDELAAQEADDAEELATVEGQLVPVGGE